MPSAVRNRRACEFMSEASMFTRQRIYKEQRSLQKELTKLDNLQKKAAESIDLECRCLQNELDMATRPRPPAIFQRSDISIRQRSSRWKERQARSIMDRDLDEKYNKKLYTTRRRRYSKDEPSSPAEPSHRNIVIERSATFHIERLQKTQNEIKATSKFVDSVVRDRSFNFIVVPEESSEINRMFWTLQRLHADTINANFPRLERVKGKPKVLLRRYSAPDNKSPPARVNLELVRQNSSAIITERKAREAAEKEAKELAKKETTKQKHITVQIVQVSDESEDEDSHSDKKNGNAEKRDSIRPRKSLVVDEDNKPKMAPLYYQRLNKEIVSKHQAIDPTQKKLLNCQKVLNKISLWKKVASKAKKRQREMEEDAEIEYAEAKGF